METPLCWSGPHCVFKLPLTPFQIARFVLGLGIGPKSTTVPVYTAECAPAPIRGALVMMWSVTNEFV